LGSSDAGGVGNGVSALKCFYMLEGKRMTVFGIDRTDFDAIAENLLGG
jgi:hypothetical protein